MKRSVLVWMVIGLLVACSDNNGFQQEAIQNSRSLYARIENSEEADTRMTVDEDNSVHWEKTDEIGVYGSQTPNVPFALKFLQSDKAEFAGNIDLTKEEVTLTYYPYQEDAVKKGNTLTITLPSEYIYKGNSNAPMIGKKTNDGTFIFKHTCGLMRITLGDLPADAERFVITSCGENAPSIAGRAILDDITTDGAVIRMDEEQGKEVIYHLDKLVGNSGLRHFFVPLPVGNYKQIEVALYGSQKPEPYFTRSVSNIKVERADMIEMPVINGETGECYILNEKTRELSAETAENVTISNIDEWTLIYGKGISVEDIPVVGQIIISRSYENIPYGFLGRVTSVENKPDGSYIVQTEQVALSEAFDKLYIDESVPVSFQKEESSHTRGILQDGIFKDIELDNELKVEYDFPDFPIHANGSIHHTGNIIFNLQYDKENNLKYYAFTWKANVKLELQMGCNFKSDVEIEGLKQVLAELRGVPIPLANGLVQVFPVYSPAFKLTGKGNIISTMGVEAEFQPMAAALYKDGEWVQRKNGNKPKANNESPWNFQGHLTFDGKIFAGVSNEFAQRLYNQKKNENLS